MDVINDLASEYDLYVVEDCAQSHGAEYKGKKAGSMSDMAAFSFYPTKILGGYGDGGMVVTNSAEMYNSLRRLRFYGMESTYYSVEHGYNSRLDELHAEILKRKLTHLDDYVLRRRALAENYNASLHKTSLILPKTNSYNFHAFYLYVCRHPKRKVIIDLLKEKDILLNVSYPWPIHIMPGYQHLGYQDGDLPNTEAAANEIFSLPLYPSLNYEQQLKVIEVLADVTLTL